MRRRGGHVISRPLPAPRTRPADETGSSALHPPFHLRRALPGPIFVPTMTPSKEPARTVKFVGQDASGRPLKRKQVAQACDDCKRKKVCVWGREAAPSLTALMRRNVASTAPPRTPKKTYHQPKPLQSSWSASRRDLSPPRAPQPPPAPPTPQPTWMSAMPPRRTAPLLFWATSTQRACLLKQP